jgi:hypothetical protein
MLAAELVALKVDVLVALYTPCALAAQQATLVGRSSRVGPHREPGAAGAALSRD